MPEKKPDPKPMPRNRHERRERAAKERKARPWTRQIIKRSNLPEVWSPRGSTRVPLLLADRPHRTRDHLQASNGVTYKFVEDAPLDDTKVLVPDADRPPVLRSRAVLEALRSGGIVTGVDSSDR